MFREVSYNAAMWLALPTLLAIQGNAADLKNAGLQGLKLPKTISVPRLSAVDRRALLARDLPGYKVTTDLSDTLTLNFGSKPPKGAGLLVREGVVVTDDGGMAVVPPTGTSHAVATFPAKKGASYAVMVVGPSACASVEGTVGIGTGSQPFSVPVASGSKSFLIGVTAPKAGPLSLLMRPAKPTGPMLMGGWLVIQRIEITRLD